MPICHVKALHRTEHARAERLIECVDIRDYTKDKHRRVVMIHTVRRRHGHDYAG